MIGNSHFTSANLNFLSGIAFFNIANHKTQLEKRFFFAARSGVELEFRFSRAIPRFLHWNAAFLDWKTRNQT
jgi:hypothetical protein